MRKDGNLKERLCIDLDFIKRCEEFAKPMVDELLEKERKRRRTWITENRERFIESQKKYLKSEKGKKARKRVVLKRKSWISQCLKFLTKEEKKRIKDINMQRRKLPGYEIDHIIPICEGGAHHPNNLRIIPRMENKLKGRKIV